MLMKMLLQLLSCRLIVTTLLLLCRYGTDGFVLQLTKECSFSDSQDMNFTYMVTFNKQKCLYFDQKTGMFEQPWPPTGFADGLQTYFNKQKDLLKQLSVAVNTTCRSNMTEYWHRIVDREAKPSASIASILPQTSMYSTRLVCHVDSFYPQSISVTWYRNGGNIMDSTSSAILPRGDWTYQVQSYVEFTPHMGDVYTCLVSHISLQEPLLVKWEPGLGTFQRYYTITAAVILVVGLLVFFIGWIFWKSGFQGVRYQQLQTNYEG